MFFFLVQLKSYTVRVVRDPGPTGSSFYGKVTSDHREWQCTVHKRRSTVHEMGVSTNDGRMVNGDAMLQMNGGYSQRTNELGSEVLRRRDAAQASTPCCEDKVEHKKLVTTDEI